MSRDNTRQQGQTLAEIVVVMAVVLVLITGLIIGSTASLKAAQFARSKSLAVGYAQEALEVARSIRDGSWTTLFSYGDINGKTWCLDGANTWIQAGLQGCAANISSFYTRSVKFTWIDPNMKVDATVSWSDGVKTYQTTLTTYFTQWK